MKFKNIVALIFIILISSIGCGNNINTIDISVYEYYCLQKGGLDSIEIYSEASIFESFVNCKDGKWEVLPEVKKYI